MSPRRLRPLKLLVLLGVLLLMAELPGPRAAEAGQPADPAPPDWLVYLPAVFKNSFPHAAPVTRIVFRSDRDAGRNGEIYVMGTDGSAQTRLTDSEAFDDNPSWSPNQQQIVFQSNREGNNDIWRMNADGTGLTNLTQNPKDDSYPAWSPDGSRIAFASNRDGDFEIFVMNWDGSGVTQLTFNGGANVRQDFQPSWSPESTRLAFVAADDVYVMHADGSGQTDLTNTPAAKNNSPSWSPDGARLAYSALQSAGDWDIFVLNPSSPADAPVNLTAADPYAEVDPVWSPDGQKIAFAAKADAAFQAKYDIYVMNAADGSGRVPLTDAAEDDVRPDW